MREWIPLLSRGIVRRVFDKLVRASRAAACHRTTASRLVECIRHCVLCDQASQTRQYFMVQCEQKGPVLPPSSAGKAADDLARQACTTRRNTGMQPSAAVPVATRVVLAEAACGALTLRSALRSDAAFLVPVANGAGGDARPYASCSVVLPLHQC